VLLRLLGAEVFVAHSGPEALEQVQRYQPAVVLLDLGMPGMDGYQVARRIRQLPGSRDMTLIALTGWGQEADRRDSAVVGFDHHLTKPAEVKDLEALLERAGWEVGGRTDQGVLLLFPGSIFTSASALDTLPASASSVKWFDST
jgi:CheY-like chemotaxis protein